ncbi:MAG: Trk system potassium transporter TrkA [Oscillospiraceae bacterium]|jgi:trk system potassium uptake protein TrkA|nr:Trk system potassium transporter TrkA [Oscillospiraceae bacterium]
MRIVIIGDGKVGYTLTERLAGEGHDLVVIDSNGRTLQSLSNSLDVITVEGNGASAAVQREAGVQHSDLLIAVTSMDELNMICCLVGHNLGVRHTIARVRNPDYATQMDLLRDDLGLSMTVNPELSAAQEISRLLRFPSAIHIEAFARGRAELVEYRVPEDSALVGMPLYRMPSALNAHVLVCAVRRGDDVHIPSGDFVLRAGDHIHVTTPSIELPHFFRRVGANQQHIRTMLIIGGGRVAYYLARAMLAIGVQVTIIESDAERGDALKERLPKALVIHGDGTDPDVLTEVGLEHTDAFVALTGIDEENIILSLYARARSHGKVIAKVDRLPFISMLGGLGLDSLISPKAIAANAIVSYVRGMQNARGSNVETMHQMLDGRVEGLEFRIRGTADYLNRPLKDLPLKDGLLIGCIVRRGATIIPGGNDTIEAGDSVVVITTNRLLNDFNDIFKTRPGR